MASGACDPRTSSSLKITRAEQATGVEPAEVSVAHWPVTSTRLLGGGFAGHLDCEPPWPARLGPAIQSSHPLESNQDLPGFSRTPRPTRREWDTSEIIVVYSVVRADL